MAPQWEPPLRMQRSAAAPSELIESRAQLGPRLENLGDGAPRRAMALFVKIGERS